MQIEQKPRLMDFYCVLSVGGSLATYQVTKESDLKYSAVFRPVNGKREDIPSRILLEKIAGNWQAQPWPEEIVQALLHAIDTNSQQTIVQE